MHKYTHARTHTRTRTRTSVLHQNHPTSGFTNISHSPALERQQPLPRGLYHLQLTGKDLEDSSDVKPAPFGESEELAEEQEQRQNAEDDGQDHGGLDRLQPF